MTPSDAEGSLNVNEQAIQMQVRDQIKHSVAGLLPVLYGVESTLQGTSITLPRSRDLEEFCSLLNRLQNTIEARLVSSEPAVEGILLCVSA